MAVGRRADDWRRTHTCGELRKVHVGERVTLDGWVHARRNHGGIYFVDLRDRYGLTQIVLGPEQADAAKLGPEFTISVRGKVVARSAANVNAERPTGEIEVIADRLEILSRSKVPPFEIDVLRAEAALQRALARLHTAGAHE